MTEMMSPYYRLLLDVTEAQDAFMSLNTRDDPQMGQLLLAYHDANQARLQHSVEAAQQASDQTGLLVTPQQWRDAQRFEKIVFLTPKEKAAKACTTVLTAVGITSPPVNY